jgi:hypothetical protein
MLRDISIGILYQEALKKGTWKKREYRVKKEFNSTFSEKIEFIKKKKNGYLN